MLVEEEVVMVLVRLEKMTHLRRVSSFSLSFMSLCTTCRTCWASASDSPDRSSLRPISLASDLGPDMVGWRNVGRHKNELVYIYMSNSQKK